MNEKEFNRDEYISECYATPAHNVCRPHKHAELIKAWADGAEIEAFDSCIDSWIKASSPSWGNQIEYRIKPRITQINTQLHPLSVAEINEIIIDQFLTSEYKGSYTVTGNDLIHFAYCILKKAILRKAQEQ